MSDIPTLPPPPPPSPPSPPPPSALTLLNFPASSPSSGAQPTNKSSHKKGKGKGKREEAELGTAALEPSRASSSGRTQSLSASITRRDRDRWRKWRDGQTDEEIALAEHTDVLRVRKSIQKVLSYQSSVSHEAVDMAANELAISTLQKMSGLIDDLLAAEKDKTIKREDGTEGVIQVPDLKMRSTVVDKITKLIQSVRKGDGLSVNVNQNNQTNVAVVAGGGARRSFESRLREKREARGLQNNDDNIIDAEEVGDDEFDEEEEGEEYEDEEDGEGDEREEGEVAEDARPKE